MRFAYAGTQLVGRSREVAELVELVQHSRLVTLTGIGGSHEGAGRRHTGVVRPAVTSAFTGQSPS